MAHDKQYADSEKQEATKPYEGCTKCGGSGWISTSEIQRGGQFAGVRYDRSRRCDCAVKA
jgi:hypothetical protein